MSPVRVCGSWSLVLSVRLFSSNAGSSSSNFFCFHETVLRRSSHRVSGTEQKKISAAKRQNHQLRKPAVIWIWIYTTILASESGGTENPLLYRISAVDGMRLSHQRTTNIIWHTPQSRARLITAAAAAEEDIDAVHSNLSVCMYVRNYKLRTVWP